MTNTEFQNEKLNPNGKYTYIGIDIDTTGRRILDEIVHIAAYNPAENYDQYVIPVMNLNPAARQRHHLRVITVGFFRMLKCTATNKVLKCRTEVVALKSFLDWLDERKKTDTDSDGIILIYYEPIKFIPFMLLEAFKKYDLLERFASLVTGFVDGHALIEAKLLSSNDDTVKSTGANETGTSNNTATSITTLRDLAKMYLTDENENEGRNFEGNAMLRARWAYKLVQSLTKGEKEDGECNKDGDTSDDTGKDGKITTDLIEGYVHSVNVDMNELTDQNKCIDLQHSFRPVFVHYFKTNLYYRYKAVTFRRVLAEKGYDLKMLEDVWTEKNKDGLTEIISKLDEIKEENRAELVDLLDSYFDPEKELIVPVTKKQNRRQRPFKRGGNRPSKDNNNRSRNTDKNGSMTKRPLETNNNNNDELEPQTPDSTTTSPQRRHRRFRKRGTNNNRQLTPIKKTELNGNTIIGNTGPATDMTKVKAVDTAKLGYISVA